MLSCRDSKMRPEGSLQFSASSWQYWLHPESHWTRGFNTEAWCSSPKGITGAVLQEMDPQRSSSQGCPASTRLQYTQKKQKHRQKSIVVLLCPTLTLLSCYLGHYAFTHDPSHTNAHTNITNDKWSYSYASYTLRIPHRLSCQIMHSPFICFQISFSYHHTRS